MCCAWTEYKYKSMFYGDVGKLKLERLTERRDVNTQSNSHNVINK